MERRKSTGPIPYAISGRAAVKGSEAREREKKMVEKMAEKIEEKRSVDTLAFKIFARVARARGGACSLRKQPATPRANRISSPDASSG